jgi:hypothetical protein
MNRQFSTMSCVVSRLNAQLDSHEQLFWVPGGGEPAVAD